MQLLVSDVATLFEVPEKTVLKWVRAGEIPVHSVNAEYRFSRAELLEWAQASKRRVPARLFADESAPSLVDALRTGGVHSKIEGGDVRTVLSEVVARLVLPASVDRNTLLEMLLAREAAGTTAMGDGVALPHVHSPIVLAAEHPSVTVSYLAKPVDFKAPDGQPVEVLFTLVSPTVRAHLQLLAQLAFSLRTPEFRAAVARRAGLDELIRLVESPRVTPQHS